MKETYFKKHIEINGGEHISPPDPYGIDGDTEIDTQLAMTDDGQWCLWKGFYGRGEDSIDLMVGWIIETEREGYLTITINPLMISMAGADAAIGTEVIIEHFVEFHCPECMEPMHTHIDCPICLSEYAGTDLHMSIMERFLEVGSFPVKCLECNTIFYIEEVDGGEAIAIIDKETDTDILLKRSRNRIRRLIADNAPEALITVERDIMARLEGCKEV